MKIFWLLCLAVIFVSCNTSEEKNSSKPDLQIGKNSNSKTPQQTDLEKSMERGALVYKDFCNQCHRPKGQGVGKSFPPLAGSNWLTEKREESIRAVKYGQKGEIEVNGQVYDGVMMPMGLSDEEVSDVMNYVMNSWGNTQTEMVTEEEVSAVEK